ncbi:hypothetical protein [Actinomadura rupiterrae]|uniref:hypothetical protein n=1 Tax=Actinomadura rupiterrae TaxID=559627 RepID=UPI0020A3A49C|nr:hypothetical protein [Actinomadura rupiterrae]MCP2342058.1 hypothetical protein [Actinomadura rupiterrae]
MNTAAAILIILALAVGIRLARARRSWTDVAAAFANLKDKSEARHRETIGAIWAVVVFVLALWASAR